jgi:hypothetical protein
MITINARCNEHPRYTAQRKPIADCKACKNLFMFKHAALLPAGLGGVGGFTFDAGGALDPATMYIWASKT